LIGKILGGLAIVLTAPAACGIQAGPQTISSDASDPSSLTTTQIEKACHPVHGPMTFYVDQPTYFVLKMHDGSGGPIGEATMSCRTGDVLNITR
jgi:hypothetical protein